MDERAKRVGLFVLLFVLIVWDCALLHGLWTYGFSISWPIVAAVAGGGTWIVSKRIFGTSSTTSLPTATGEAGNSGHAPADYGVPHVRKFNRTEDGFTVSFNRLPVGFAKATASLADNNKGLAAALMGLVLLLIGGIVALSYKLFGGTNIEVTKDTIDVNGKKLARADFGGFSIGSTYQIPGQEQTLAVLSYAYGNQSFPFGGAWTEKEAAEVASALNLHLRRTPKPGDETRMPPEQLRAARPTDF